MDRASSKPIILVVDDQPKNLKILGEILTPDYEIIIANNGLSALKSLTLSEPDLVLLDIMMPEMDGFEVIQQIKKNQRNTNIPVIFLSAKDQPEDIVKGFELGAVDYITKPFNHKEVLARVKLHVELFQVRNELSVINANKDNLIAVLANDLKNQILSALGLSELLIKKDNLASEKTDKYIQLIHSSSENTYALLMNLIHWSKLQTNHIVLYNKETNLVALVEDTIELLQTKLKEKNISLVKEFPDDINFIADEEKIKVVLRNLLANAISFSSNNGSIHLSAKKTEDNLYCSVAYAGNRMNAETLKSFFSQPQITSFVDMGISPGILLSLWLSHKFVELHKGSVNMDSDDKRGTNISFSIPLQHQD